MNIYETDNLIQEAEDSRFTYYPVTLNLGEDALLDIILIINPTICLKYNDRYYKLSEVKRVTDDGKYAFEVINKKIKVYVLDGDE